MPKTHVVDIEPSSNTPKLYFNYWCDDGDKWDLFTMLTGLFLLIMGLCCSVLEVGYIIYTYHVQCYGVGLWCAAGFLFIGILAITLYQYESVPSATLMLFSVICDFFFGVVMPITAIIMTISCGEMSLLFLAL
ncbi:unnamed protein product [Heterobilharzia americana]|nr:unnamed protein product [Heterobilharzia americana]CAH8480646.1 unnamed protein product [Heterobilharzia americana]